jgi:diguanylate cyclase (GGDEF)-like protein
MHRAAGALHGTVGEMHGTAVQGSAAEPGDLPAGTPADVVERFAELCDLPLFRAVSAETMLHLAQRSETVAYQTGEVIVRQGEAGDSLYVIVHGRVDVLAAIMHDGVATESAVASLAAGDAVGELSLIDSQPRSATCAAMRPTVCVRLTRELLWEEMRHDWALAEVLLTTMAARLRRADASLAEHARDPLTGVYNRRALFEIYDRESRRAQRTARRTVGATHAQILAEEAAQADAERGEASEAGASGLNGEVSYGSEAGQRDQAAGGAPASGSDQPGQRVQSGRTGFADVPPLAALFIDVDKFKTINDTYGHQTGDDVLCAVAHTLTTCSRNTDHVARFGGDEFVVLLPESGLRGANHVADRIRIYLSETPPGPVPFSISIGAAVVDPMEPPPLEELMAKADAEMYRDKERRR